MPISFNGSGTITGITAGGLPDSSIVTTDIANASITAAKLDGAQTGTAPIYGIRAFVNFDGTRNAADTGASTNGANVKIRSSGNVSSVLKNAAGDYTITFSTAFSNTNYCAVGSGGTGGTGTMRDLSTNVYTTTTLRVSTQNSNTGNVDSDFVNVVVLQ